VSASGKRWAAQIRYGGKGHSLGTFATKQEAALAYDREARQCGEEKPLNYESMEGAEEAATKAQAEYALTLGPPQPKPRPASGYYGVSASGKRWGAQIRRYRGKKHSLGTFATKQEAALAYDREVRQCGKEKPLNYESMEEAEEAATKAQAEYALTLGPPQPKPRPASGNYGVRANGKRWAAQIYYGGKNHRLGTFDTKQEAALAYDREARQCGKEKPLNYESMEGAEEAATKAQAEYAALALCRMSTTTTSSSSSSSSSSSRTTTTTSSTSATTTSMLGPLINAE
jgi:hypothetical protein